ncbi:MAG: hypothetical protein O2890_09415 [Cyanobacteria bacterium]|nr:hypothetical protein [Cyanobacteriota bacterium]MDA0866621.1 hypothetical protein [Cyanobacteriota bacterium]
MTNAQSKERVRERTILLAETYERDAPDLAKFLKRKLKYASNP